MSNNRWIEIALDPKIYTIDKNGWYHVGTVACDLCPQAAEFFHPEGGARCHACPRPGPSVDYKNYKKMTPEQQWEYDKKNGTLDDPSLDDTVVGGPIY